MVTQPVQNNLANQEPTKKGIIVALVTLQQPPSKTREYITELTSLADTWGVKIVQRFIQRLNHPHAATFIGKGKIAEIAAFIKTEEIDYAIFDDELTPSQVRNLEKLFSCPILDRSLLILNIFSMRAKTKQAKTQVALAHYQYLLPRLTRMWTHLSSQKGGNVGMRGPGEKELETDKRLIQQKITTLRKKLAVVEQQSATQRKTRVNVGRVALVGYTNVGKSTLMQLLSKSDILSDDKLFATLDATIRRVVWHSHLFLLTDTVGFIRKLPHTLIACFRSTLTEIKEADLLLHVVDASHPRFQEQINTVDHTLTEIGAEHIPRILVFNKIDAIKKIKKDQNNQDFLSCPPSVSTPVEAALKALEKQCKDDATGWPTVFISAAEQWNIELLKDAIVNEINNLQKVKYIQTTFY